MMHGTLQFTQFPHQIDKNHNDVCTHVLVQCTVYANTLFSHTQNRALMIFIYILDARTERSVGHFILFALIARVDEN